MIFMISLWEKHFEKRKIVVWSFFTPPSDACGCFIKVNEYFLCIVMGNAFYICHLIKNIIYLIQLIQDCYKF